MPHSGLPGTHGWQGEGSGGSDAFFLATIADAGGPTAAVVQDRRVHVVPGRPAMADLLAGWESSLERLAGDLRRGALEDPLDAETVRFLPPTPQPPNLYMAGANYADHLRELR